jgi:hypothetical protein
MECSIFTAIPILSFLISIFFKEKNQYIYL